MTDVSEMTREARAALRADLRRTHSSTHNETTVAIEDAKLEARTATLEEAVQFLRLSGFEDAADALDMAAFGRPQP